MKKYLGGSPNSLDQIIGYYCACR